MESAASLKFSPEDPQGSRRRKRQDAGSEKWVKSLPTPRKDDAACTGPRFTGLKGQGFQRTP